MTYPALYILRHGQTKWNAEHRIQGSLDSPLTRKGRAQADMQRELLNRCDLSGFDAFSSPQGRAFHTASIALNGLVPRIETDRRLSEIGVGDWEGKCRADFLPEALAAQGEEGALAHYEHAPGGEGFDRLRTRCTEFISELKRPAVLVTHDVTSRMLRLVLLGMDTRDIAVLPGGQGVVFHLENCVQTKL